MLEHVTFSSNNATPTNGGLGATRTIEWQVNDGSSTNNLSAIRAATETVIHLHTLDLDTTAAGFNSATTYIEHGSPLPIINTNDAISDPDSNSMTSAIVTLTNARLAINSPWARCRRRSRARSIPATPARSS